MEGNQFQESSETKKFVSPKCNRCRNHGLTVRRKEHRCPRKLCECTNCSTIGLRAIISKQHKVLMPQKKDDRNDIITCHKRSCRKCSNHGEYVSTKYHECPYKNCDCKCCLLTVAYQRNQKQQIAMRRQQLKKDFIQKQQERQKKILLQQQQQASEAERQKECKSRSRLKELLAKPPLAATGGLILPEIRYHTPILQNNEIGYPLPTVAVNIGYPQQSVLPGHTELHEPTCFDQRSHTSFPYSQLLINQNGTRREEVSKSSCLQDRTNFVSAIPSCTTRTTFSEQWDQNVWSPRYRMMSFHMDNSPLSPNGSVFPYGAPQYHTNTNPYQRPASFPSIPLQEVGKRNVPFIQCPGTTGYPTQSNTVDQDRSMMGRNMVQAQQVPKFSWPQQTYSSPGNVDEKKDFSVLTNVENIASYPRTVSGIKSDVSSLNSSISSTPVPSFKSYPNPFWNHGDSKSVEGELQSITSMSYNKCAPDTTLSDKAAVNYLFTKLVEFGQSRVRNDSQED